MQQFGFYQCMTDVQNQWECNRTMTCIHHICCWYQHFWYQEQEQCVMLVSSLFSHTMITIMCIWCNQIIPAPTWLCLAQPCSSGFTRELNNWVLSQCLQRACMEAVFLYCCAGCLSCPANATQMSWATWAIRAVVKKSSLSGECGRNTGLLAKWKSASILAIIKCMLAYRFFYYVDFGLIETDIVLCWFFAGWDWTNIMV